MSIGQLQKRKFRTREFGTINLYSADEKLQQSLPELRLPPMADAARAAFRDLLEYERPPANGSLIDVLALIEARGHSVHPGDWVPDIDLPGRHPALYQPWVDWLADQGITRFHEDAHVLSEENWDRWKPLPRIYAFKRLLRDDQDAALALLKKVGPSQPAATRLRLLEAIDAGASFSGVFPKQVPLILYFIGDPSAKISNAAAAKLQGMHDVVTEEAHAAQLARHLRVTDEAVTYQTAPEPHAYPFSVNWSCTTFAALAAALGLREDELARKSDLEGLGSQFILLANLTASVDVRSIIADRLLEANNPECLPVTLFRDLPRPQWERGLHALFRSVHWSSVQEYLGLETGTLGISQARALSAYDYLKVSVPRKVGKSDGPLASDPLRALALCVNKEAAQTVLNEALSLGMKSDNPRLTMLKLNLAL